MSTYGDRGIICLQRRCEWRGVHSKVALDQNATPTDLQTVDLLVGGGAQDRQEIVMRDLRGAKALALREKIDRHSGVFTCGATPTVRSLLRACCWAADGLGLFDFVSVHPGPNARRCIGNLVIQVTAKRLAQELEAMTGFHRT